LSPIGKQQALMTTTMFFGAGALLRGSSGSGWRAFVEFSGLVLGKSMLETKGFFWAWLIPLSF